MALKDSSTADGRLDREAVGPLLRALDDPENSVRVAAVRALVRLPLDRLSWVVVSGHVLRWLELPKSTGGGGSRTEAQPWNPFFVGAEVACFIPVTAVRTRLREVVMSGNEEAARAAARSLAKVNDPAAIPQLLRDISSPEVELRRDAAESLSHVDASSVREFLRERSAREPDKKVCFWLNFSLARLGEKDAIEKILSEWSHWPVPGTISNHALVVDPSLPEGIRTLFEGFLDSVQELGYDDQEYAVLKRLPQLKDVHPSPAPSQEAAEKPTNPELRRRAGKIAESYLRGSPIPEWGEPLPEEETLGYVEPELGARLVTALFEVEATREHLIANEIMTLVAREPLHSVFSPDISGLFEVYLELERSSYTWESGRPKPLIWQLAWTASRAGSRGLIAGLAPQFSSPNPERRAEAAHLVQEAVLYEKDSYGPQFGGGSAPLDVEPQTELFDFEIAPQTGSSSGGDEGDGPEEPSSGGDESEWPQLAREPVPNVIQGVGASPPPTGAGAPPEAAPPTPKLPAAVPLSAGAPGESAGPRPVFGEAQSEVLLGASAPQSVRQGDEFTARFVAYVEAREEEVRKTLEDLSARSKTYLGLQRCRWKQGITVTVRLTADRLEVSPSERSFVWSGDHDMVEFDVRVPDDAREGFVVLKFDVFVEGLEVANLRPEISIGGQPPMAERNLIIGVNPAHTAFASYASSDVSRVLDIVSALKGLVGMDVFTDCLSIKPGEEWKPTLEREIMQRDVFLLFWSVAARESDWVTWEWKTALGERGLRAIKLQLLDTVHDAPPPAELASLQFSDPIMLIRKAKELERSQPAGKRES